MSGSSLPIRSLSRSELLLIDSATAILLTAGYVTFARPAAGGGDPSWLTAGTIILFMGPPVAVRRLWPMPVFVVVVVASLLSLSLGVLHEPFLAAALTAYTAAATGPGTLFGTDRDQGADLRWDPARREPVRNGAHRLRRRGWSILGGVSLILVFLSVSTGSARPSAAGPLSVLLPGLALVGAMWTAGVAVRERREYARRRIADRLSRAVVDERLRIAREVHDIVTHNLGVIAVKAAVARHVAKTHPGEALVSLETIEKVSRTALTDMRQVLHVLRAAPEKDDDGAAPSVVPGIDDVRDLVERARAAGVEVRYEVTNVEQVPGGAALSVYRIVQEALTNVMKHAGPTRCRVAVRGAADAVVLEVQDDGPTTRRPAPHRSATTGGFGLRGIAERVTMHGGDWSAGPRECGGFEVRARLPYRAGDPAGNR